MTFHRLPLRYYKRFNTSIYTTYVPFLIFKKLNIYWFQGYCSANNIQKVDQLRQVDQLDDVFHKPIISFTRSVNRVGNIASAYTLIWNHILTQKVNPLGLWFIRAHMSSIFLPYFDVRLYYHVVSPQIDGRSKHTCSCSLPP